MSPPREVDTILHHQFTRYLGTLKTDGCARCGLPEESVVHRRYDDEDGSSE